LQSAQVTQSRPTTGSAGFSPLDAIRILNSAGGALFIQGLLHTELARIEWAEEKRRLLTMLAITLLGFASLLCALVFAGGLVLAATWETPYRIAAVACLVLLYGLGAAVAWRRFRAVSALGGEIFTASLEELAADAALLKTGT
jgi:uncharacterized membrane protein YqjE